LGLGVVIFLGHSHRLEEMLIDPAHVAHGWTMVIDAAAVILV
jgi:hypothetical protein